MVSYRPLLIALGLIIFWQLIILVTGVEHFILPSPIEVAYAMVERFSIILGHAWVTLVEIILGLIFGIFLGTLSALFMGYFSSARYG